MSKAMELENAELRAEVERLQKEYNLAVQRGREAYSEIAKIEDAAQASWKLDAYKDCDLGDLMAALWQDLQAEKAARETAELRGWQDAIEAVRASLRGYPDTGGDVEIMREVERIAKTQI